MAAHLTPIPVKHQSAKVGKDPPGRLWHVTTFGWPLLSDHFVDTREAGQARVRTRTAPRSASRSGGPSPRDPTLEGVGSAG